MLLICLIDNCYWLYNAIRVFCRIFFRFHNKFSCEKCCVGRRLNQRRISIWTTLRESVVCVHKFRLGGDGYSECFLSANAPTHMHSLTVLLFLSSAFVGGVCGGACVWLLIYRCFQSTVAINTFVTKFLFTPCQRIGRHGAVWMCAKSAVPSMRQTCILPEGKSSISMFKPVSMLQQCRTHISTATKGQFAQF